ncbi:hypothetical protein RFI_05059 [Reticulomyxa filosa]|uniref:Uncharacterized protein n=1 Tax=Reticulomyxa filosa TaxID=46433 RepID=X6P1W7_RETFI|nr:hypothetical protein RFI_05059 [Reticulomyxa filosa]|eukprot:ETO32059.1 hypothetical protein RFI_05059 [Reticulomyxa filosa]
MTDIEILPTHDASATFNFDNVTNALPEITDQKKEETTEVNNNLELVNGGQKKLLKKKNETSEFAKKTQKEKKGATKKKEQNKFIKKGPHSFSSESNGNGVPPAIATAAPRKRERKGKPQSHMGSWKRAWKLAVQWEHDPQGTGKASKGKKWQEVWTPCKRRWQNTSPSTRKWQRISGRLTKQSEFALKKRQDSAPPRKSKTSWESKPRKSKLTFKKGEKIKYGTEKVRILGINNKKFVFKTKIVRTHPFKNSLIYVHLFIIISLSRILFVYSIGLISTLILLSVVIHHTRYSS